MAVRSAGDEEKSSVNNNFASIQEVENEITSALGTFGSANLVSLIQNRDTPAEEAYAAISTTLDTLLEQLSEEPTDEEEISAKFLLYEGFAKTIETIRESTMQFWDENRDQFTGLSAAACERDVKSIDSEQAMGIYEDADRLKWMVYGMTKKVNENSKMINNVLASLRARLQLLGEQDVTCPMCLEVGKRHMRYYTIMTYEITSSH